MSTPHNNAKKGAFANICIMPGDPLRAKWIAETFLDNVKLVNDVRGMLGFTGYYKGKKVSVMGHGMGVPSMGIYAYELYKFYGVDYIIRVGSGGAMIKDIKVGSIFVVDEAFGSSTFPKELGVKTNKGVIKPTKTLFDLTIKTLKEEKIPYRVGRAFSEDCFYSSLTVKQRIKWTGAQMAEMESYALYACAIKLKKQALTLLTCSDSMVTGESMPASARQTSFKEMTRAALETAIKVSK